MYNDKIEEIQNKIQTKSLRKIENNMQMTDRQEYE